MSIADTIRHSSKSVSLRGPITALVSTNQAYSPADQVQCVLMLAVLYAQELKLDLRHELAKMERAVGDVEPSWAHEVQAIRDYLRRHVVGK